MKSRFHVEGASLLMNDIPDFLKQSKQNLQKKYAYPLNKETKSMSIEEARALLDKMLVGGVSLSDMVIEDRYQK